MQLIKLQKIQKNLNKIDTIYYYIVTKSIMILIEFMDGRKNNKGIVGKAGRKSKSEEMQLVEMLNKHIDKDEAIVKLKLMIDEGDFKAIQLYMNYMYGKPKETKDISISSEQPLFDL